MLNTNMAFKSDTSSIEIMLEAFFCVEPNEHVKAWRWHCFTTGNYHYWPKYSNRIVYGSRE